MAKAEVANKIHGWRLQMRAITNVHKEMNDLRTFFEAQIFTDPDPERPPSLADEPDALGNLYIAAMYLPQMTAEDQSSQEALEAAIVRISEDTGLPLPEDFVRSFVVAAAIEAAVSKLYEYILQRVGAG